MRVLGTGNVVVRTALILRAYSLVCETGIRQLGKNTSGGFTVLAFVRKLRDRTRGVTGGALDWESGDLSYGTSCASNLLCGTWAPHFTSLGFSFLICKIKGLD